MGSIKPATVFWGMVIVLGAVLAWELRVAQGRTMSCAVEEILPGSKGVTAFARCEGTLTKVAISDIALRVHGQPGGTIQVREARRGPVWDKPAARHTLSLMIAPFFVLMSLVLWFKRNA